MIVYKATYKDRNGKQRKTAKWYLDFADHNRLRHKIAKNGKQVEQPVPAILVSVLTAPKAHARPNAGDRVFCVLQQVDQRGRAYQRGFRGSRT